jgi:DNA repair protein RecN (Recombination protein N)
MLTGLHISNIVLIDRLNLEFGAGLNVLTGETGAGKSILLDALALALGARSDTGLLRAGCDTAGVIAEFSTPIDLSEHGIESDGTIILRRSLSADGKSRAWINDTPVSIKTLKQIGDSLCEIHGQFENHSLLDPTTHIATLDEFGKYDLTPVRTAYFTLHVAEKSLRELRETLAKSQAEREFLEHNVRELAALNPLPGEEEELAAQRTALMDAEKNAAILSDATTAARGLDEKIFNVAHILGRIKTEPNPYSAQIDALYEIAEIAANVESKITPLDTDTASLEDIEARLFAIRGAARKHKISAEQLPEKLAQMTAQLAAIDNSDAELKAAEAKADKALAEYKKTAAILSAERIAASAALRDAILAELPDLKLGQTDFKVEISPAAPSANGSDEIVFMIKTNPGTPFAPLHKIASGGELARLMLALRVVLMGGGANMKTFVFDEVDTGISGATAAAVGARLARLSVGTPCQGVLNEGHASNVSLPMAQVIVITHSAQVAGYADKHFLITKTATTDTTKTSVCEISDDARLNEIARIISGDKITAESIATARTLIVNNH